MNNTTIRRRLPKHIAQKHPRATFTKTPAPTLNPADSAISLSGSEKFKTEAICSINYSLKSHKHHYSSIDYENAFPILGVSFLILALAPIPRLTTTAPLSFSTSLAEEKEATVSACTVPTELVQKAGKVFLPTLAPSLQMHAVPTSSYGYKESYMVFYKYAKVILDFPVYPNLTGHSKSECQQMILEYKAYRSYYYNNNACITTVMAKGILKRYK